jgi:signal transduction histidine kinase
MRGMRAVAIVTVAVSVLATVIFAVLPPPHLDAQWQSVRVALETAGSLIALIATFLIYGRLLRRMYLNELLLAAALATLALSNLLFVTVPTVAGWAPDDLTVWLAPYARSLGAVLFTLAAFVPHRRLGRSGPLLALAGTGLLAVLGLATLFVRTFSKRWNVQYAATVIPPSLSRSGPQEHPVLFLFELLVALLYGLAAVGLFRRARRYGDEFFGWLAIAAILAVLSHINYSMLPSLDTESVQYAGDIFRFMFYVALLIGCMREIWSYWKAISEAAILEERRRIARELHDGLAQELAYIYRNIDPLAGAPSSGTVNRLRLALERALIESRRAISALAPPRDQAVEATLAEAAMEIAERSRIQVELDLVPGVRLSPARVEALVRIASEAITNAARHSGAHSVSLHLERHGSRVRLRVADRGRGFDATAQGTGFGLVSMRERARSVGGELHVSSTPGKGSKVEVLVDH